MEIERNQDRCNRCMLCVRECVAGVWQNLDGEPVAARPELCNLCSHCLAVCPREAVIHSGLDAGQVQPLDRGKAEAGMYKAVAMSRRSVRQFTETPVARTTIAEILDCARYSPTASNSQNVSYLVVTDPALLQQVSRHVFQAGVRFYGWTQSWTGRKLLRLLKNTKVGATLDRYLGNMDDYIAQTEAGRDFILHGAPVLILICAPQGASFAVDNCSIAATNIMNYAHTLGLGTCYIGFLVLALRYSRRLRSLLGLPRNRRAHACLVLGYPAYRFSFTVFRKSPGVTWRG